MINNEIYIKQYFYIKIIKFKYKFINYLNQIIIFRNIKIIINIYIYKYQLAICVFKK